ncbi:VanZ family protein [Streptomyces sp. DH37]|uniref:VanZ family protein n=1 Tax=Streptomyces sp. DH37 TaxID=3040122 RepID=UPI002442EFA0|nr:VanZ family protein [Streptomyces sp. DH37]MDG9705734.1 VanZ family protein [Streptomyces sp. DH37]
MQRHHHGGSAAHRIRAAGLVLLCCHLLFVGWLTLRPLSVPWVAPANLRPFASIHADLLSGPRAALEGIGGGLALLAPLGVLLPMAVGRVTSRLGSWARTVFAAAMISLGIELVQPAVPGQVANVDALLLNTTGAALVHLLCYPALRARLRGAVRQERPGARRFAPPEDGDQGATPRTPRVGIAP